MEAVQALLSIDDCRENRVAVMSRRLAEGRERLERMQLKSMGDFHGNQRDLQSQMELIKWMEEQQVAWARERESMESELRKLRSDLEQSRAVSTSPRVSDVDRGSEEIDLKAMAEPKWINASRQVLAPITPEAVRARTPSMKVGVGKENVCSDQKSGDEIQRLRREIEHWRQKANRLSKDYKGLKSQYNYVQTRLVSKGDAGQLILNADHVQAALEDISEKPPRIRQLSPGQTTIQGGDARSLSRISFDRNAPGTPEILQQAVVEVVTGHIASASGSRDPQAKVKTELESSRALIRDTLMKNNTAGGLDAGVEVKSDQAVENSGTPTAIAGNRKRPLEPSGTPAFKFVEPVRKKAERENLQGTECKLCKKFYDAVIAGNAEGMVESRCNHLEKSRHRFRDLPPATPEGFWNIGFDSEF